MKSLFPSLVLVIALSMGAVAQTSDFEQPPVSGVPTSLPVWSGFSPVVLQYGDAYVQDAVAGTGLQALELAPDSLIAWSPDEPVAPAGQVLVTSFQLRFETLTSDPPTIPFETLAAVLYANTAGLMALDGDGAGGGTWQTVQPLAAGDFITVTVIRDYDLQSYDVLVNSSLVADDFGFKDTITTGLFTATFESSERAWVDEVSATFSDLSAPTPNPMTFDSPPASAGATSVTMTATTASDPSSGITYYFESTTPGGEDSGWQVDPTYTDTGLTAGVSYTYQVRARDAGGNETAPSDPASATPFEDTTPPQVVSRTPGDGATGVSLGTDLTLVFDEAVEKGSGSLLIKESLGNAVVAMIDVSAATVSGNEGSFNPPSDLEPGTAYYVELSSGALTDLSGNPFAGLAGQAGWSFVTAPASLDSAALIAHYTFDSDDGGSTPDSVGSNSASLGNRVQINTTVTGRIGSGALEMLGSGTTTGPGDGAVTSNSFSWTDDARTVSFWWRADTPLVDASDGAFVSFGDQAGNGTRFEVKEQGASNTELRVEVKGTGENTNPGIDDGNWHFIAVTVPNSATFADVSWYVDGSSTDLNSSSNTLDIATGIGPIVFGDSILTTGTNDRVPNGYLDDFQLYDEVLDQTQISSLFNNPGSVIGMPADDFEGYVSDPAFGLDPSERGFARDPDGDRLANGLEAWFGTHPGEFTAGLANIATNGTITTFTHPQNETRPVDVGGFYEWSPNLIDWYSGDGVDGPPGGPTVTFSVTTIGTTTTVSATTSEAVDKLFVRAGVTQN